MSESIQVSTNTAKMSVCILVKNAEHTIRECLESVRAFDEIILLDNGSTDKTLTIAQDFNHTYQNLQIFHSEFIGFGALKNLAISKARNDWILSIDSDEVLESSALAEIQALHLEKNMILALPRKNLYNDTWIKACGWYPDFVWRIFHKSFTRFNDNIVHESIIVPSNATKLHLQNGLKHYAYDNIEHLIEKMQKYSSLWASQNQHKKSSPFKAINHGLWTFIRNYFFKKGICYGYKGFVISVCNGLGAFFKYMKLYELQAATPSLCSLIITTYNQKERLAMVLDSVRDLEVLPSEVIIADDGSTQDTAECIKAYQADFPCTLRHIWHEDNGFRLSAIRNRAICEAKGEYIIIIDGDMILESHFVADHLRFAKKGTFVQGSRVILEKQISEQILESKEYKKAFESTHFKSRRIFLLAKLIYKSSKLTQSFFAKNDFIKGIRGCNMGFYKADCEAINGFNEEFIGWGREDSEFVARFLFGGGEFRRLKFGAIAYHIYHDENTRNMLESNHRIYLQTIHDKKTSCVYGMRNLDSSKEHI